MIGTTVNLRPFNDYDENNVINLFRFSGNVPAERGQFVTIIQDGWKNDQEIGLLGNAFGFSQNNVVAQRYGTVASVGFAGTGDRPLGMMLYDTREVDENGEKLLYHPHKAAEMQAVVSGQNVPILTKGIVLLSGIEGNPVAGNLLFCSGVGLLSINQGGDQITAANSIINKVGKALGRKDAQNYCLVKIEL